LSQTGTAQSIFSSSLNIEGGSSLAGFTPAQTQAFALSTLTLNGAFQQVTATGNNLFVGTASNATGVGNAVPGTAFVLQGSGNVIYAGAGDTVTSFSGGNQVNQLANSQATSQVSSFVLTGGQKAASYSSGTSQSQLAFLATQGTIDGTYIAGN